MIHGVSTYSRDGHQNLDEETGDGVLDIFVLDLEEILRQLLHELKTLLEIFERDHLDSEEERIFNNLLCSRLIKF